jgi:hypothetical protein
MEELFKTASDLAGREVEVEKLKDGRYVVLFMSLTENPPPKADTEEEALIAFIKWAQSREARELPPVEELLNARDIDTGLSED